MCTVITFEKNKLLKQVPVGFSWSNLFFGFFTPFYRGDIRWGLVQLFVSFATFGFATFAFPFFYNRVYIINLLENGWLPDENGANILIRKGIIKG
jgi:hypothetical protein